MIASLKLENIRQFKKLSLDFEGAQIILLHGDNTRGKSTILESIAVLTNLKSPFTSSLEQLQNNADAAEYMRIEADIDLQGKLSSHALFQQNRSKKYMLDGKNTSRQRFCQGIAATIFSPEQIEHLMISPSKRRDFLDQLITQLEPDYIDILTRAQKVLRQRNAYLKKIAPRFYSSGTVDTEDSQLQYWTAEHSKLSSAIIRTRAEYVKSLVSDDFYLVYTPNILEDDEISISTDDLTEISPDELNATHLNLLASKIKRDVATGHTNYGYHRDDWAIHDDKNVQLYGSRGEKRMAIGRMILAGHQLVTDQTETSPVLLLDDISSELDDENIRAIITEATNQNQQVFITTIRLEHFPEDIINQALVIDMNNLPL